MVNMMWIHMMRRGPIAVIRRELFRAVLERAQSSPIKAAMGEAPEINDPKAVYEVEELLNRPYMNRDEVPLAMDIFKPIVPKEQDLPVIVTIHGGGLVIGDRSISRRYARVLARRGYLVFSIEYRLAPRANSAEQLDDVCAGMDLIGEHLVNYNVDFTRMFLTAESAGAFLAIYVAAMKKSKALQKAIGYAPTRMTFKALGLISGMIYTDRPDPIGWTLSDQFYGSKRRDPDFLRFMNPENPEILDNLPPTFLITSRGDFLNNYSLMYHKALKKAGRKSRLVYYGEKELEHSFAALHPELPQSLDAIDRMTAWFEEQASGKAAGKQTETKAAASRKAETLTEKSEAKAAADRKPVTKAAAKQKPEAKTAANQKPGSRKKPVKQGQEPGVQAQDTSKNE